MESETGTGKTFAYLAPALALATERGLSRDRRRGSPLLLVAAPTQELAVQIGRQTEKLLRASGMPGRPAVFLGGSPVSRQILELRQHPEIIIGTIGRLSDLVRSGAIDVRSTVTAVFDEADRMFTPEMEDETTRLLGSLPATCSRVLVSATLPDRVRRAALPYLRNPVSVTMGDESVLSGDIEHWCFLCDPRWRVDFIRRIEAAICPARCLVFLSRAGRVDETVLRLSAFGIPVEAISAGKDKESRRVALDRFARGAVRYLVTSDLAARGLDIPGISHVVSLDLPDDYTVYTHRAGRTGRAGAKGISIVPADKLEIERASRFAVRGGFVFRCKSLDHGTVIEPPAEDFFKKVHEAWEERTEYRRTKGSPSGASRERGG